MGDFAVREMVRAALDHVLQTNERGAANMQAAWAALRMIREAVEEFGPVASLESPEAVLLRGPEPTHEAEAIIEALQRIRSALSAARDAERDAIVAWLRQYAEHEDTALGRIHAGAIADVLASSAHRSKP